MADWTFRIRAKLNRDHTIVTKMVIDNLDEPLAKDWGDAWETEARGAHGEFESGGGVTGSQADERGRDVDLHGSPERMTEEPSQALVENGERLAGSMTPEESAAVEHYTTGGYRDLNGALMEGRPLTESQQAESKALDSVISKAGALPPDTTTYRGLQIGPTKGVLESESEFKDRLGAWAQEKFPPGSIISGHGYQSTSTAVEPALDASLSRSSPGIVMEIQASSGAYLGGGASHFDDESEVLMGRDTRFQVISVDTNATFLKGENYDEVQRTVIRVRQL